jgi:hypothetical protein
MKNKFIYLVIAGSLLCTRSYSQEEKLLSGGKKPQQVLVTNTGAKQAVPVTLENSKPVAVSVESAKPLQVMVDNTTPLNVSVNNTAPLKVDLANATPINVKISNPSSTPAVKQPYAFAIGGKDGAAAIIVTGPNEHKVIEYICGSSGLSFVVCGGYTTLVNQKVMIVVTPNSSYTVQTQNSNTNFVVNGMVYPQ